LSRYAVIVCFIISGIISIVLFVLNPSLKELLYFSLFAFLFSIHIYTSVPHVDAIFRNSAWKHILFAATLYISAGILSLFIDIIINGKITIPIQFFLSFCVLISVITPWIPLRHFISVGLIFSASEIIPFIHFSISFVKNFKSELQNLHQSGIQTFTAVTGGILKILFRTDWGNIFLMVIVVAFFIFMDVFRVHFFNQKIGMTIHAAVIFPVFLLIILIRRFERIRKILILKESSLILEKEKERFKERKRIYADIHDQMGAKLTDMLFYLRKCKKEGSLSKQQSNDIEKEVNEIINSLHDNLNGMGDLDKLSEDFVNTFHLMLLRRYSKADRELIFSSFHDDEIRTLIKENYKDAFLNEIQKAMDEIITNDLKYGKHSSQWKLFWNQNESLPVKILMESKTDYGVEAERSGLGTSNILKRITSIGGSVDWNIKNGIYSIGIFLPQKPPERAG